MDKRNIGAKSEHSSFLEKYNDMAVSSYGSFEEEWPWVSYVTEEGVLIAKPPKATARTCREIEIRERNSLK